MGCIFMNAPPPGDSHGRQTARNRPRPPQGRADPPGRCRPRRRWPGPRTVSGARRNRSQRRLHDPAPVNEPAGRSNPAPRFREAPPAHTETVQDTVRRYEFSRTRLRINLTWTAAVTLMAGVIAAAVYLPAFPVQDAWFRSVWPWRAHVWNRVRRRHASGASTRRARRNAPIVLQHPLPDTYGPDCPAPDAEGAGTRCPPWETWPTDPAPRWSADGPPQWSR